MFTFKKIALVGAAGLAALSMSCSDSDGSPGGEFNPAFGAKLDAAGDVVLEGKIVANQPGGLVSTVKVTAAGNDVTATVTPPLVPGAEVNLAGVNVYGVCAAAGKTTAGAKIKIKVVATFNEGDDLDASAEVTVDCSSANPSTPLIKKNITLSNTGSSYADIDGQTAIYKNDDIKVAATAKKIDLIAYNAKSGAGAENKIYAPGGIAFHLVDGDDNDYFYSLADASYDPLKILFYPLPAEAVTTIKAATDLAQVSDFMTALTSFVEVTPSVDVVDATVGSGFLVFTSEGKFVAVIINAGGTAATVDLGITGGL